MTGKTGCKILVVEDEALVAMLLEELIGDMGHEAVVAITLDEALGLAKTADIDLCILDVNLAGKLSFPVADILKQRAIPYVFSTGYGNGAVPGEHAQALSIEKPFQIDAVELTITEALKTRP